MVKSLLKWCGYIGDAAGDEVILYIPKSLHLMHQSEQRWYLNGHHTTQIPKSGTCHNKKGNKVFANSIKTNDEAWNNTYRINPLAVGIQ